MTLREGLKHIAGRIASGKSGRFIGPTDTMGFKPYSLAVGTRQAVKVPGGFICVQGLDRYELESLRDEINLLLGRPS